ncbi:MAG: putative HNHc nuclease, partial [Bacillota bacterium]
ETGMGKDPTKEYMKLKFLLEDMEQTADQIFSLSNAPVSLVCAFQRFLVRFILDWDIPCKFPLLDFVDDVPDYIYACLIHKKCCITGTPAELHHIDRVGMGRDRTDIVHEGMEVLPLNREKHQEAHTMSDREFFDKYHLPGGIVLDKTLCRIWHLKARKKDA